MRLGKRSRLGELSKPFAAGGGGRGHVAPGRHGDVLSAHGDLCPRCRHRTRVPDGCGDGFLQAGPPVQADGLCAASSEPLPAGHEHVLGHLAGGERHGVPADGYVGHPMVRGLHGGVLGPRRQAAAQQLDHAAASSSLASAGRLPKSGFAHRRVFSLRLCTRRTDVLAALPLTPKPRSLLHKAWLRSGVDVAATPVFGIEAPCVGTAGWAS
mmetsp:Transcript_155378/g.498533  ORF Transcript_155378/g.498533 Transcript_155378/m.498533 type:complete len:211 (+) Transcript_155378:154-786(+)